MYHHGKLPKGQRIYQPCGRGGGLCERFHRFTDGGEFGLGAEIGISTQKLHARGPMGLNELTSMKFIVLGSGQIR